MVLKTKRFLGVFFISGFVITSLLSLSLHAEKKEKSAKASEAEDKEWQTMQSETTKSSHVRVKKVSSRQVSTSNIQVDLAKGKISMSKLYFVSNEDIPTPESEKLLKDLATLLNKKPELFLRVEGYSDSLGSDQKNLEMSQKRADRVKEILVKNGVTTSRLEAVGLGSLYPVASDVTPEGQEKNRRIEFIIITAPTQAPETVPETQTSVPTPAESQPVETQPITAAPPAPISVPSYTPPAVPLTVPTVPETQPQPVIPPTITIPTPAPITNPPTAAPLIIVPNYSTTN